MKQKKENSMALLLHWAGEQKFWLFLAILLSMCSGLCIIVPYIWDLQVDGCLHLTVPAQKNLWYRLWQ